MNSGSDNAADIPPHDDPRGAEASDAELVRRACGGDRGAAESLVLRHQAAVTRLLWRFARQKAELEDLVQETFVRMIRALPDWRADSPFAHWLLRVATNVGRDHFRRESVRRRWVTDSEPPPEREDQRHEAVDPAPDPAARAAANEVKARLAQLPPDDRALLTLYYLEGWELKKIAGQFGWTVTATKIRAWRARRALRALLQEDSP